MSFCGSVDRGDTNDVDGYPVAQDNVEESGGDVVSAVVSQSHRVRAPRWDDAHSEPGGVQNAAASFAMFGSSRTSSQ